MTQRDMLQRSHIKNGKTMCALHTHIKNNVGHGIDWDEKEVSERGICLREDQGGLVHHCIFVCIFI